jgi:hypothetical protein
MLWLMILQGSPGGSFAGNGGGQSDAFERVDITPPVGQTAVYIVIELVDTNALSEELALRIYWW